MPMICDIRCYYPDANIDWVVEESYVDLVGTNPIVRRVVPIALRRWRKNLFSISTVIEIISFYRRIRQDKYDFIFDVQGLLKTGLVMRIARLSKFGKRVGLGNATEGSGYESISRLFHTNSIKVGLHTHAVLRGRQVAAKALAYTINKVPDFNMQISQTRNIKLPFVLHKHTYVVLVHGSSKATKKWPVSCWAEIGNFLIERGLYVLLPWGNEEEKHNASNLAGLINKAHVLPKLSLIEVMSVIKYASLVIGLDTGLTHIAAAFNCPTIELYCASPRWKTEGNWSEKIINLGDLGYFPTTLEVKKAIATLLYQH